MNKENENKAPEKSLKSSGSKKRKYINKAIFKAVKTFFLSLLVIAVLGGAMGIGMIKGIIDNAPEVDVDSIVPLGYATTVYNSAGQVTDTLVMAGSNREEATYDELPKVLIDAFVSIEDSRFWKHRGIDTRAILRAISGVITGNSSSGGGSTITQQLIKNNVFNGGRERSFGEKVERKFQEMYLAVKLEKQMDKKLILTNYLNTINLGSNSLGVKVAARRYFGKDVSELTLSEATVIAGITKGPTKYNPITGQAANAERRKIILQYMYEQGYITKEQQEEALADDVYSRIQNVNTMAKEKNSPYSYFTDALISQVTQALINEMGYTETQAHNLLYSGGLSIYTTQDPNLQQIVDSEVNNPENYPDTKYSLEYRLTVTDSEKNTHNYSEKDINKYHSETLHDGFGGLYPTEDAAKADAEKYKSSILKDGDTIVGESVKTVLEPQVSFVLMDQKTGSVKAISGGRGEKTSSLSLNRATDTTRQPGSTFKVISSFAPALDTSGNTLATTYYDAEYTLGDKTFKNWYDKQGYLGWSSIRDGIVYSMNIVALKTLMETVTPRVGVQYATDFGISTLTDQDYNASLALGGLTKGVSNLELTGAFATIANQGVYTKPMFFTKIVDHNGKTILDNTTPTTHRVIKDSTAFLLTDAMAASTQNNRKFASSGINVNSTSTRAHLDHMSVAGKSGTTSNNVDVWFVGFTPYYTAGVWAGCDENQTLSDNGGTSFHKDIWRKIMTKVSEGQQDIGFPVPDSVETAVVCRKSGKLPIPGVCDHDPRGDSTYTEYFAKGTVPTEVCDHHTTVTVCRDSGLLPTPNCPTTTRVALIIPSGQSQTDDSQYAAPSATCNIHGGINPIVGSDAPTEGATDNQDVGVAPNSNHPVVTPRQNNNVSVGVAPGDDHAVATQAPSPVITPSKPDKKNKKKQPSEVVTPETTAPAHIKSTPPTKSDDDSDVLHGPGVTPKNDGPHASPGPSVSTEGPGGQASPILVGPGE
mgnify:FL=1|nr:transglycosylase domain-containing protein [uncultured Lachnoanaerobaculum sp.]